jgi:hypothetical protein
MPMTDIIRLVRYAVDLLISQGPFFRSVLLQPLITVGMLVFLYAGWHVRDEGSIADGLRVAFIDTKAFRAKHLRELESTTLQTQLRQAAQTDHLIDQLLASLLDQIPNASRVRLDVFHNGVTGVTGTALLRYDVTNAVAARGRAAGTMVTNQQLSDFNEFLPALLAGKCQTSSVESTANIALRARLEALGVSAFMVCPVTDVLGRLLGTVVVQWDARDAPPQGELLGTLMERARSIGVQIASALDLRTPLPYPFGHQAQE